MKQAMADSRCIGEAAEWRLMGLLLERPRPGWSEQVAALGAEVREDDLRAIAAAAPAAREGEYLCCLGPGGTVSPREVTYQPFADPGQLLASLASIYAAFAFRPQVEEPLDHIAVEVAFVGYLLLKEAFALAAEDGDAAALTAAARREFVETHLAPFAAGFARRVASNGPAHLHQCAQHLAARLPAGPDVRQPPAGFETPEPCAACGPSTWE